MRIKLFLLLTLCLFVVTKGQQPAYFILGENQFKGVQIYDMVQDNELNYWIATNEGLYLYNYYTYQKIDIPDSKSNAVFGFVISPSGIIYCHNLNNQVFKIKNKQCTLFYELKDDELKSDISLTINNHHLLIGGKKIIQLSEQGKVMNRFTFGHHYLSAPFNDGNTTLYHLSEKDSVLLVSENKCFRRQLSFKSASAAKTSVLHFFKLEATNYAIDLNNRTLYTFNPKTLELTQIADNNLFEKGIKPILHYTKNCIWVLGTKPGVVQVKKNLEPRPFSVFYKDAFISDVYEDKEGNILLSTFDKGIIVIPDLETPDVTHKFQDDIISSITYDDKLGLLMGSSKGKLMVSKNSTLYNLDTNGLRSIEKVHTRTNLPLIIYDNGSIKAYTKNTKTINTLSLLSLKDVAFVSDNTFYIGTNVGILKCIWNRDRTFTTEQLRDFNLRIYSLCFNPTDTCLYTSTSKGLFAIDKNGLKKEVTLNNAPVFPNTLIAHNGFVYATHKKGGVLVIKKKQILKILPLFYNKEMESPSKIKIYNNTLICKTQKGLLKYNLNGEYIGTLITPQMLSGQRLIDFAFEENTLWISHTGGIQKIDLLQRQQKISKPSIKLLAIRVNDSLLNSGQNTFNSTQNKFQFTLSSPTLRNKESIRYHYKLTGNDEKWNINDHLTNQITYNALAPGNYTFTVKAGQDGVFSDDVNYSFHITAPVYVRWWFITLMALLLFGIVSLIYKWQLNKQRKKSQQINELNASKLIAIQSQMNPHFIFNSLNSIQDLILKGDVEKSYSYITTFSNMVRKTLNYSEKDFIDFEKEIQLLELYLSLEQLRFKKDFSYTINTNAITDIEIPPMIIQPFIENALVHGLLHKDGEKKLTIHFDLNETLTCTIEDNGVGREKAKAIKERQRSDHESFSVKATRKRFDILSEIFTGQFGFTYEDINENGTVSGTRVILVLPVKHKF